MRRVAPTRAAMARVGCPSKSAIATYSGLDPDQHRARSGHGVAARNDRRRARLEARAESRSARSPFLGGQTHVARRQRQAIGVSNRRHDADFQVEIEIAHQLLDHGHLLGVLLSEERDVRAGRW